MAITRMSAENCARRPGRRTFTTTSVPSASVARCTWAIDAAAIGSGSKVAKSSVTGRPSECLMMLSAVPGASGGTSSRHHSKASTHSSGSRPLAVAMNCPSFTYAGPPAGDERLRLVDDRPPGLPPTRAVAVTDPARVVGCAQHLGQPAGAGGGDDATRRPRDGRDGLPPHVRRGQPDVLCVRARAGGPAPCRARRPPPPGGRGWCRSTWTGEACRRSRAAAEPEGSREPTRRRLWVSYSSYLHSVNAEVASSPATPPAPRPPQTNPAR